MFIGDILVALGLVSRDDVAAALRQHGGKTGGLGRNLISLGKLTAEDLAAVIGVAPVAPTTLAETGISFTSLLNLLLKVVYATDVESPSQMADLLKLPLNTVLEIVEIAEDRQLLTSLGSTVRADISMERRYVLTKAGVEWAHAAMRRSEYVGPAPVPLTVYCDQIYRQSLANARIDQARVEGAMNDMVISDDLRMKLGPAINSSRSMLLYGPPGNGKTSIGERIGGCSTGWSMYPTASRSMARSSRCSTSAFTTQSTRWLSTASTSGGAQRAAGPAMGRVPTAVRQRRWRTDHRNARTGL